MTLTTLNNKMVINRFLRTISLATLLAGVSLSSTAKRVTVELNDSNASGFNALDYVLQKPLPLDTFPAGQKGFGRHFFLGVGGGVSVNGNTLSSSVKPSLHFGGQMGSWFTPVHGLRVGADVGRMSVHKGTHHAWGVSVRADYLINFSSLLRGYNPYRKVELIGGVGVEYRRLRQAGVWGNNLGLDASLQLHYNATPSFYLFAEPELAMMTGFRYDGKDDWRRVRPYFSFNIGMGYRILTGRLRRLHSSPFDGRDENQMYFGVGGGLWDFPVHSHSFKNAMGSIHLGKMFSSTSGLQLTLSINQRKHSNKDLNNKYIGIGSLDYVLNLGNAFGGYSPKDVFQTQLNVGVSAGVLTRTQKTIYSPGLSVGLTGLFRLSEHWGIFIHPQMYAFQKSEISRQFRCGHTPLVSVDLGLRYNVGNFGRFRAESYREYNADSRHWFIEAGGGYSKVRGTSFGYGGDIFISFGKRFTPISTWRARVDGSTYKNYPRMLSTALHIDYLTSLTTATMGYDPNRLFDLQLVLGANLGAAHYNGPIKPIGGFETGLQANFRLSKHLDLFVEPMFMASSLPSIYGSRNWYAQMQVQLGLRYKLGLQGERGRLSDSMYGTRPNFAGFSAGLLGLARNISLKHSNLTGGFDISIGRWFALPSGLRFTFANDWLYRYKDNYHVASAHLDYLLNFTSLIDRNASRRFHIIGAVGAGLSYCHKSINSKKGVMAYGGVQFRYNLPGNIDIHLEPGVQIWQNRVIPTATPQEKFEIAPKMVAGASYRF